jgi:hypothetical protein
MRVVTGVRTTTKCSVYRATMGLLVILAFALAVAVSSPAKANDGLSEAEMCRAFRAYLAAQVQGVLDFVRETEGLDGLARVHQAGTDQFEIRSFNEAQCHGLDRFPSRVCSFSVGIETVKGVIERTVTGCFIPQIGGQLVFIPRAEQQQVSSGSGSVSTC